LGCAGCIGRRQLLCHHFLQARTRQPQMAKHLSALRKAKLSTRIGQVARSNPTARKPSFQAAHRALEPVSDRQTSLTLRMASAPLTIRQTTGACVSANYLRAPFNRYGVACVQLGL